MPTINLYPETPRPAWLKLGVVCKCLGEGNDLFRVTLIGKNAAALETLNGRDHGWESFRKLHSPIESAKPT